jgi:hypothetical protein
MYDVYGRTKLAERELEHLRGYRGSQPVRIGNGAHLQVQLDVYGGVIFAAYDFVEKGGCLQVDEARLLVGFGRTVCKQWRDPDSGMGDTWAEAPLHLLQGDVLDGAQLLNQASQTWVLEHRPRNLLSRAGRDRQCY